MRHWFEMKSNMFQFFWSFFQKLFWRAPHFKSNTSLRFMGNGEGRAPKGSRAKRGRALPPSVHHEMMVCSCFWNVVRAKKIFWKNLQKFRYVWFHFKSVTHAILQIWNSVIFAKLRASLVRNPVKNASIFEDFLSFHQKCIIIYAKMAYGLDWNDSKHAQFLKIISKQNSFDATRTRAPTGEARASAKRLLPRCMK